MAPVEARFFQSPEHQPEIMVIPDGYAETVHFNGNNVKIEWQADKKTPNLKIENPGAVRVKQMFTLGDQSKEEEIPAGEPIKCGSFPYETTVIVDTISGEALLFQHKDANVIGVFGRHRKP